MKLNDIFEIEISNLDHQGRGIGKIGDLIIFIPNSLPGEIVKVKLTLIKKNYLEGEVLEYITKSKNRIVPICPYYDICGGCDLMHLPYDLQSKYKEDKVRNIMKRYANLDCVTNIIKSDSPLFYRNKVTFQVKNVIGLYKKKSYEIIPIDKCYIVDERINEYLNKFRKMNLDGINQIIVRTSSNDIMIIFSCFEDVLIDVSNLEGNIIKKYKNTYTILKGNNYIVENIGDKKYKLSPSSFFQVNINQVKKLYDKVVEYLELDGSENVLDLYCGTGTIGIYLAMKAKYVFGIEINEDAITDANFNKKLNNINNIDFVAGDTAKFIKEVSFNPDKIVVDPPRKGLDKKVIDEIIEMHPKKIVYVSCDPITLARDLNLLKEKYDIEKITPLDMFCNTMHVECVCALKFK